MFSKILVANRGEIALRVMRACRDLGIGSVAIYGEGEQNAPHVRYADDAYRLASDAPIPYLDIDSLLEIAAVSGAEAVHPGYGFLAENAEFATRCAEAGLTFIGPPVRAISAMGDKIRAREIARQAGIPLVAGSDGDVAPDGVAAIAEDIGYPVALKASAGGGGRGFRVAHSPDALSDALAGAAGEAERYFGDARVFIERYLEEPRHVEIQILADAHGTVVALGERDCSIQRRHQKLIEETPSPVLRDVTRKAMESAAVELARSVGYVSAGTVEFLVQGDDFYFLEMNTRIQVEHPVTEMVTGVDLVAEQIRIAAGASIDPDLGQVRTGHAIECRINAEDTGAGFQPVSGVIDACTIPMGPGVRFDGAIEPGLDISPKYDSLLGKLVTWGANREQAIRRMKRALDELHISGVTSTVGFHQAVMTHPVFERGQYDTRFLERYPDVLETPAARTERHAVPATLPPDIGTEEIQVEINGRRFDVRIYREADSRERRTPPKLSQNHNPVALVDEASETIVSPIQGTVLSVLVEPGETVRAGDVLCVIEAMKMENEISAGRDGTVVSIEVTAGKPVQAGAVIAVIGSASAAADGPESST